MPPAVVASHAALDWAVDKCYRPAPFASGLARPGLLLGLYQQLAAPLLIEAPGRRNR